MAYELVSYVEEIEYVEETINNDNELEQARYLAFNIESMFVNGELNRFISDLNKLQAKYGYSKSLVEDI